MRRIDLMVWLKGLILFIISNVQAVLGLLVRSQSTDEALCHRGKTGAFIGEFVSSRGGGFSGPSDILFVPEPVTVLLLGLGVVMLEGATIV